MYICDQIWPTGREKTWYNLYLFGRVVDDFKNDGIAIILVLQEEEEEEEENPIQSIR